MVREKAIKRVSIFLFLVLFFSFRLHGQETQIYTYEQLESLLKQKNSKLLAAQYRVEAATQILQATGPHYWPDLAFYYRYFPNGISFQEGEIATKNWLTARLSFDLVKFFKIRSLKTEERQMDVHLAELVVQELEQDALFAFRNLYTHTLYKKIQTEHYARLCSTSQKILEIRRFQFDHQEALRSHILEAEMEVSQNTKLVQQFKGEFAIEKRKLAATLRISPDAFELKESFFIPFVPDQKLVMQSALNKSVQSRKSALVLQKEITSSNASYASNLRLEPYVGYRLRELRQGQLESGPEIGVQVGIG